MELDLVIVGGGPAGLTAGIYASSRKISCMVLEAGDPGGQLTNIYPDKAIENYPGLVVTEAKELVNLLISHAQAVGCGLHTHERVLRIKDLEDGRLFLESDKDEYTAKAVIVAIGAGLYKPKRLGAKGEVEFEGRGVAYTLPSRDDIRGKRIIFIGGGNSALEMALLACEVAEVCVVHRRDKFRADNVYVERIAASGVDTYMSAEVEEIKGDDQVRSVVLKMGDPPVSKEVEADLVVINIGFTPDTSDLEHWGLNLDDGLITVDTEMRTSRRGVFACGDIVTYNGKFKQIITGCGEAATAANSAYKFIIKPYWA
ncbi:MAG: NAD(P)/FAD-dependent oxidoreductase [Methanomassiliicoccales archaeon]|jgi:thioredoxin reductase (NADPH)|nr:NAD(P)/FAD-dependent oxidoreductase [Methanomassiliicoccales archaeon]